MSYAGPSTKSKLRRDDVLFPKADALSGNKNQIAMDGDKGGRMTKSTTMAASSKGSPVTETDLDRIMGIISSSSEYGGQ